MAILKYLKKQERPREKALLYGIESLTNAELLAVILCTGDTSYDALELAQEILKETGGITNLLNYSLEELKKIKGIKEAKAVRIKASQEIYNRILKEKNDYESINSIFEAAKFFKSHIKILNQEILALLTLNQKNKIISFKTVSIGSKTSVNFSINNIISYAIKDYASKIIICHTHPSNNSHPSRQDEEQTSNINLISSMMGIELIDHLILTDSCFYSIFDKVTYLYE